MALISRWEISNFLDSSKGHGWSPDFIGEKIDFAGLSTAMVMDNGTGKTSIAEAELWLLSLDKALLKKTASRLAPASGGHSTHIRVEFVNPRAARSDDLFVPLGARVDGEHWVFGAYAVREPGGQVDYRLYRYQGVLEEVPVHIERSEENGRVLKALMPDDAFAAALKDGSLVKRNQDWLAFVDEFWPLQQLRQVVEYQKRGGGDKAASFYDVRTHGSEKFDQAFFRQFVAPEILRGIIDHDDEVEGAQERSFEFGLVAHANEVLKAKIATEDKEKRLASMRRGHEALKKIVAAADRYLSACERRKQCVDMHRRNVSATKAVLEGNPIPGLPLTNAALEGLPEAERQVLLGTALRPDGPIMVARSLLADLSVAGHGVMSQPARDLLPCAMAAAHDGRRLTYFDLDALLGLAERDGLPEAGRLATRLKAIRETVLRRTTQAWRRRVDECAAGLAATRAAIEKKDQHQRDLLLQISMLRERVASYLDNERAFTTLKLSGWFTEEELADPIALQRSLKARKAAAEAARDEHVAKVARLKAVRPIYDEVAAEFSGADLDASLAALAAALDAAKERHEAASEAHAQAESALRAFGGRKAELDEAVRQAEAELTELVKAGGALDRLEVEFGEDASPGRVAADLRTELTAARADLEAVQGALAEKRRLLAELDVLLERLAAEERRLTAELTEFEKLARDYQAFQARFPDRNAATFAEDIEREIADAKQKRSAAAAERASLLPLAEALEAFCAREAGADPAAWIREAGSRRAALISERRDLENAVADLDRRLKALERNPVAPSPTDHAAHEAIRGLQWTTLHRAIEALPVEADRRASVLSHFSALLFAPVFTDVAAAAEAAARLSAAEMPMPTFLAADVVRWSQGAALPILEEQGFHHAVMGGVSTRAVRAILDPTLVERERAEVRARKSEAEGRLDRIAGEMEVLDPEGPLLKEARLAHRALKEDASPRIAQIEAAMEAATRGIDEAAALLTDDNRRLATSAAQYARRNGNTRVVELRAILSEVGGKLERARSDRAAAQDAERTLDARLPGASRRFEEAQARKHWIDVAEQCEEFVVSGGRARLAERRSAHGALLLNRAQLEQDVQRAIAELSGAGERKEKAEETRRNAELRSARWAEKLRTASHFVHGGDLAYLDQSDFRGRELRREIGAIEDRLAFDFASAAEYVAVMGTGIDDYNRQIAECESEMRRLEEDIAKLRAELPQRGGELERLRAQSGELDRAAFALHRVAVKPYELGLEGGDDPTAAAHFSSRIAAIATALHDPDRFHEAMDIYEDIAAEIEAYNLPTAKDEIHRAEGEEAGAGATYQEAIADRVRLEDTPFDAGLLERVRSFADAPTQYAPLAQTVEAGIQRETLTWEKARNEEARSREKLVELLRGLAITAGENLRTMARVMAPKMKDGRCLGAGFQIEAAIAPDDDIDRVLAEIVSSVEHARKRFDEDAARGEEPSEKEFREAMSARVRDRIYDRMFPNARIRVVHPLMRAGRPFYFVKEGISGGQATALMLLWTIKLAAYWIERSAARKRGAQRRKLRNATHSIIIVDGLFSDLSDPPLIRQSMDAMKKIRGGFQLIGLIHSPYYRNDWELFPTCLVGRKVAFLGEDGVEGKMVTIQAAADDRPGRVSVDGLRARSTLRRNEDADETEVAAEAEDASDEAAE